MEVGNKSRNPEKNQKNEKSNKRNATGEKNICRNFCRKVFQKK